MHIFDSADIQFDIREIEIRGRSIHILVQFAVVAPAFNEPAVNRIKISTVFHSVIVCSVAVLDCQNCIKRLIHISFGYDKRCIDIAVECPDVLGNRRVLRCRWGNSAAGAPPCAVNRFNVVYIS